MRELARLINVHVNGKLTGPNTELGKKRVAQNALQHGLRSDKPVLPWESAEEWEHHRQGIVATLGPANPFELELAERVALSLWRLKRVSRYETAVTVVGQRDAVDAPQRWRLTIRTAQHTRETELDRFPRFVTGENRENGANPLRGRRCDRRGSRT